MQSCRTNTCLAADTTFPTRSNEQAAPLTTAQNGVCHRGMCKCESGWKGSACTQLDLLPTLNGQDAGYNYMIDGQNVSSWGGVPLQDETGMYHMWVSHFTHHCGIIAWGENSVVLHTTSKSLLGPYRPANGTVESSTVFPVFSHEPDVKRGPNGTLQ